MAIHSEGVTSTFYIGQLASVFNGKGLPMYGDVVDANNYFQFRLFVGAWTEAEMSQRTAALAQATRMIDHLNYAGTKLASTQANMFPRTGMTSIPDEIKHACYEIALKLLDGFDPDVEIENLAAVGQGYAGVRGTYNRDFVLEHIRAGIPSADAWNILRKYLIDPNSITLSKG